MNLKDEAKTFCNANGVDPAWAPTLERVLEKVYKGAIADACNVLHDAAAQWDTLASTEGFYSAAERAKAKAEAARDLVRTVELLR